MNKCRIVVYKLCTIDTNRHQTTGTAMGRKTMSENDRITFMIRGNKRPIIYLGGNGKQWITSESFVDMSKHKIAGMIDPISIQDEGKKNLTGKPEWSVVPMEAMRGVVRVFESGAKTYGKGRTWLPGIRFSKLFSAICRHLFDWFYLEKNEDEKSHQHPLCHVIANCLMLLTFIDNKRFDDRKKSEQPKRMTPEMLYLKIKKGIDDLAQSRGRYKNDHTKKD